MKNYELMAAKAGLSIYHSMYDEQGIKKYKINRKSNHVEITYMNGATTYNQLTETSKEDLDENNELVIKLHTTDTLTLLPGLYYYQIKLNRYNEEIQDYEIHTLVKQTPFYIDP